MDFSLFINFNGECKEATAFYAKVFKSEVKGMMTFDQMPEDPNYKVDEVDKNKVVYSEVLIHGCNVMFCDTLSDMSFIKGNNFTPTISLKDKEEIRRIFDELKEGGKIDMDLQETFGSELFAVVTDKFGVTW